MENISRRTCRKNRQRHRRRTNHRERRLRSEIMQNIEMNNDQKPLIKQFLMELNMLFQRYPVGVSLMALIQLMNYVQTNFVKNSENDSQGTFAIPFMAEKDLDERLNYDDVDIPGLIEGQSKYLSKMVGGRHIKDLLNFSR
jgi:hypothetical protein